jgi:tetratricopeptide (TPR) repeat protein
MANGSTGKGRGNKGWLAALIALMFALGTVRASAATDPRELKAREDFAAGRYQQALDLFARLYAEKLHPIYLRNIGRCYQNLGDPEHAITSFRDYLRNAKSISPDERKEVEGFISEMEDLKRKKEVPAGPGPGTPGEGAHPPGVAEPVTPIATEPPKPRDSTAAPTLVLLPPPPPRAAESPPVYERWWFWAIVGGVVAAGLGGAAAAGVFTKTQDAPCSLPRMCL